ncbi:GPW/gp25 family protein, partial [Rhizobium ruizarguesonis]
VRRSVINYGLPPFSGRSSRDFDREELAKEIAHVLAAFEPRLKESATKVTVSLGDKSVLAEPLSRSRMVRMRSRSGAGVV